MFVTLLGLVFIVSSVALLLLFLLLSRSARREQLDLETCKASLEGIAVRLKRGELTETEADAARLALLARTRPSSWSFSQYFQSAPPIWVVAAAAFLIVLGIGETVSYVGKPSDVTRLSETISVSDPDGDALSRLDDYARSIGTEEPSSQAGAGEILPDVNTMIERLAARLKTTPQDIEGWRMLGWANFQMGRYDEAATAFESALKLDPNSAELKRSYEEARAKASGGDNSESASSLQTGAIDESGGSSVAQSATEATAPGATDAAIRSMVDGLARRLESSPRDVEGWIRLMRSRVVLGENEVAATAYRKALQVFADDRAASGKITAAATDLGLKTE